MTQILEVNGIVRAGKLNERIEELIRNYFATREYSVRAEGVTSIPTFIAGRVDHFRYRGELIGYYIKPPRRQFAEYYVTLTVDKLEEPDD